MENYTEVSPHIIYNIQKLKNSKLYRGQVFAKTMIEKMELFDPELHIITDKREKYIDIRRFRRYNTTQPYGWLIDECVKNKGYYHRCCNPITGNIVLSFM